MSKVKVINACDKIALFSLYVIAFQLPISKGIIESFSILAIVCFIVKLILNKGSSFPKTSLNLAIFVYFIITVFSVALSSNLAVSMRNLFGKTFQYTLFFFVVVDTLNSKSRIRNFLYIFFLSSLVLGIDGIYQHFTHKDFIRSRPYLGIPRLRATFGSANDYGCYLAAVIPFAAAAIFNKESYEKLFRALFVFLFLLLSVCLLLTVSRGAWFSYIAALLFLSLWIKGLLICIVVAGLILALGHQFFFPYLKERIQNFLVFSDHSSQDRMMIWKAAWKMVMFRPWLGLGLATFMFNFERFVDKGYPFTIPYTHNCYLQMAAETGIIGLLSFLAILAVFFYQGIRYLKKNKRGFFWFILLSSLASVLGYCVQMTVDTNFYSLDLGILFWLLLGIGIAALKGQDKEPVS